LPQWLTAVSPDFAPLGIISLLLTLLLMLSFVVVFIPNPRNREDNTSGVLGLMALADSFKDQPEVRERVQLIFLDNEEWGLLGSLALKGVWDKKGYPYQQAEIINLDCIARGQKPLLVYHKQGDLARRLLPFIAAYLPQAETLDMGIMPLSDNYTFRHQGAVNISFADRSLLPGGYYIPRIHSPRDDDFTPDRFWPLIQALGDYAKNKVA
jgi:prepilin-type processing-associated H-X9-DG protein